MKTLLPTSRRRAGARYIPQDRRAVREDFADTTVPESVRALAEKTVTQTREAYEQAKDALEEAVDALERSFDAAGQGAAAFNRKLIDIAQRNLNSGFDLAKSLAGAKNLAEIVELQSAFIRQQFDVFAEPGGRDPRAVDQDRGRYRRADQGPSHALDGHHPQDDLTLRARSRGSRAKRFCA